VKCVLWARSSPATTWNRRVGPALRLPWARTPRPSTAVPGRRAAQRAFAGRRSSRTQRARAPAFALQAMPCPLYSPTAGPALSGNTTRNILSTARAALANRPEPVPTPQLSAWVRHRLITARAYPPLSFQRIQPLWVSVSARQEHFSIRPPSSAASAPAVSTLTATTWIPRVPLAQASSTALQHLAPGRRALVHVPVWPASSSTPSRLRVNLALRARAAVGPAPRCSRCSCYPATGARTRTPRACTRAGMGSGCLGGNSSNYCTPNNRGALCEPCTPGMYQLDTGVCQPCDAGVRQQNVALLLAVGLSASGLALLLYWFRKKVAAKARDMVEAYESLDDRQLLTAMAVSRLKILFISYQVR
jgi:hypothetical protein